MECKKCEWSWEIEVDDENPYLCHKCGFDSKSKSFFKCIKKIKN